MLNFLRSKQHPTHFRTLFPYSIEKYVITSKIGGHSSEGLYEFYKDYDNKVITRYKEKNKNTYGISVLTTPE